MEDAKTVCEPQVLHQIVRWKRTLGVYLAPFLHGKRYTSFGRHFTKVDKLKEIVDRLKWYVQDGDTIVDFSCGSNDFSFLMKEMLHKMGKRCSFRNYDLIAPKIMGLNPPFGVHASLANKFIDKALTFNPKLLILIVPKETRRLDRKNPPYDIIWEDDELLSGKSFYLPGSVDVNDHHLEQSNLSTPPLYLWSRPDWTAKHKAIAEKCGHIRNEPEMFGERRGERVVSNYLMEENHDCYRDFSRVIHYNGDLSTKLDDIPEYFDGTHTDGTHEQKDNTPSGYHELGHRQSLENLWDTKMVQNETSQMGKMYVENNYDGTNLFENNPQGDTRPPSELYPRENRFQGIWPTHYASRPEHAAALVPNAAGTAYMQQQEMNEGAFPMPYQWPRGPNYYYNSGSFYPSGPGF